VAVSVSIPRALAERLAERGFDVESYVVDLLVRALNLDPETAAVAHLELAVKYLEEGKALIDRDPVQASEKLNKAAEEAVKALAVSFQLSDILKRVEERGRWTVTDLDRSARAIAKKLGEWFRRSWDSAWVLHVWGFHEARLDADAVRERAPDVEKMVREAEKLIKASH